MQTFALEKTGISLTGLEYLFPKSCYIITNLNSDAARQENGDSTIEGRDGRVEGREESVTYFCRVYKEREEEQDLISA